MQRQHVRRILYWVRCFRVQIRQRGGRRHSAVFADDGKWGGAAGAVGGGGVLPGALSAALHAAPVGGGGQLELAVHLQVRPAKWSSRRWLQRRVAAGAAAQAGLTGWETGRTAAASGGVAGQAVGVAVLGGQGGVGDEGGLGEGAGGRDVDLVHRQAQLTLLNN